MQFDNAFVKSEGGLKFEGKKVKSFYAQSYEQRRGVEVVSYDSEDKFIAKLKLKQTGDELFIAKGYDEIP